MAICPDDPHADLKGLPGKAGKASHDSPPLYPRLPAPHCRLVDGLGRPSASSDSAQTLQLNRKGRKERPTDSRRFRNHPV